VVVLRLRQLAQPIHERERLDEARQLEGALERTVHLAPALGRHTRSIYDRRRMTLSTEDASGGEVTRAEPRRAGNELVLEFVFRPLANLLVPVLARIGVAPPVVVLANAATGLGAALVLARGELLVAALLLQLKTLLDNSDGQLARVTGRVTLAGRYLDTEADLVVNLAVFAALGHVTGKPLLAAAAFVGLTLVLAVDFNLTELYRERRGLAETPALPSEGRGELVLATIYRVTFGLLDRAIRGSTERRFDRLAGGASAELAHEARLAYVDPLTVSVLANLGLSTQLAALGVCLALGAPLAYLWIALASLALLVPLQLRAERCVRAVLRQPREV
jgi:phosphatidylglycerophosphate synthase